MHVDRYGGEVVSTYGFDDYPALAKVVSQGIGLHEGRSLGLWSFWGSALMCVAIIFMCLSGPLMWWRRRPRRRGAIGAPRGRMPIRATPGAGRPAGRARGVPAAVRDLAARRAGPRPARAAPGAGARTVVRDDAVGRLRAGGAPGAAFLVARGPPPAQPAHQPRRVRLGGGQVDQPVEQLVVAGRRQVEPLADDLVLGAGVGDPVLLEGEDLAVEVGEVVHGSKPDIRVPTGRSRPPASGGHAVRSGKDAETRKRSTSIRSATRSGFGCGVR